MLLDCHLLPAMEKSSVVEAPVLVGAKDKHGSSSALCNSETFLRLLPIGLSVAALVLMLNNSQANDYGSLSYTDLAAFRYLVHANGICAGYSLLSAAIVVMPRPSTMSRAWTLFLLDQELYIHIGWPLYHKYGHAFEAFKIIVTNPDSVLNSLTREIKEVGLDGQEEQALKEKEELGEGCMRRTGGRLKKLIEGKL